jgi:hypothetical protein
MNLESFVKQSVKYSWVVSLVEINQNVTTPFTHATCSHLWLSLGVFTTIKSNFNYFGHSYNYDAIVGNFIMLDGF